MKIEIDEHTENIVVIIVIAICVIFFMFVFKGCTDSEQAYKLEMKKLEMQEKG